MEGLREPDRWGPVQGTRQFKRRPPLHGGCTHPPSRTARGASEQLCRQGSQFPCGAHGGVELS